MAISPLNLWQYFASHSAKVTCILGLLLLATFAIAELALHSRRMGPYLALCGLMLVEAALMCTGWVIYLAQRGGQ